MVPGIWIANHLNNEQIKVPYSDPHCWPVINFSYYSILGKTEGGANFDPTPFLCEMAELLEKEHDNYIAKDPDPFEDRHPTR